MYVKVYEVAELVSCRNITHFSATFNRVVGVPLWGYGLYLIRASGRCEIF